MIYYWNLRPLLKLGIMWLNSRKEKAYLFWLWCLWIFIVGYLKLHWNWRHLLVGQRVAWNEEWGRIKGEIRSCLMILKWEWLSDNEVWWKNLISPRICHIVYQCWKLFHSSIRRDSPRLELNAYAFSSLPTIHLRYVVRSKYRDTLCWP